MPFLNKNIFFDLEKHYIFYYISGVEDVNSEDSVRAYIPM
jgi:hypothetical protein